MDRQRYSHIGRVMKQLPTNILRYILALQEAFVAILPFIILMSIVTLFYFFVRHFHIDYLFVNKTNLFLLMRALNNAASIAAVFSIGFFLARRLNVSPAIASLLSLAVFASIVLLEKPVLPIEFPVNFTPGTIFAPIVSTAMLAYFYPKLSLHLPLNDVNKHIYRLFNYVFVFLAAYAVTFALYGATDYAMDAWFDTLSDWLTRIPDTIDFFLRDLLRQLFWYIGIHGSHITYGLLDRSILVHEICPHVMYPEFNRLFTNMGGAGMGLAFLIALLIQARKRAYRLLAKISIPFVIFNINTLLIYPFIVFNRYLFAPFVLIPLFNFLAGYAFVTLVPIQWSATEIPWTLPALYNGYVKSGGDWRLVAFQALLLTLNTIVYNAYLKKFFQTQSVKMHATILEQNLGIQGNLSAREGIPAYRVAKEVVNANIQLDAILPTLTEENLSMHYQPKVETQTQACSRYEALIRYWNGERIVGPVFLGAIEQAGLAPIVDVWVSQRVKQDFRRWREEGCSPEISINLHPDTLLDSRAIDVICTNLQGERVVFEIVERSFVMGKRALENLKKLRKGGFGISIDDFGVGYSNLVTVIEHEIYEIKLDKVLIDTVEGRKGYLACKKMVEFCHEIGAQVVAEGVETAEQYTRLAEIGVDYIQGFYFAPALAFEQIKACAGYLTPDSRTDAG